MKTRLITLTIMLIGITLMLCTQAFALEGNILEQIEVTDYDANINYMQEIYTALEDGSDYAIRMATIYEAQRNLKIEDQNLDFETTDFFNSEMTVDDIIIAVNEYISPPYELSESERQMVEAAVMAEAGSECIEGKMMIAQCILDNALMRECTVGQIIKDYQIVTNYYGINDECSTAVSNVFDLGERVTEEAANVWYAPAVVYSSWHESQIYITTIGGHKFFRTWV